MYHNMLQATAGQLVFGRDMILNTILIADWEALRIRKQKRIGNIIKGIRVSSDQPPTD